MPGCYDHPDFTALEREDPDVLLEYGRYVLSRPLDEVEATRVRARVGQIADVFVRSGLQNQDINGRCVDLAGAFLRVLEAERIWCFTAHGSAKFTFETSTGCESQYLWLHDWPDFPGAFVGHAWVVAPPVMVMDFTAKFQRWSNEKAALIPEVILVQEPQYVQPTVELMGPSSFPNLKLLASQLVPRWKWLRPVEFNAPSLRITYQPESVTVPDLPGLEGIQNIKLAGLTVKEFFEQKIAGTKPK